MIDLVEHRIALAAPLRLTPHSFWHEHIPFGMFLVSAARPRILVELGTHYGDSYCAFCQAVQTLKLDTLCYAVDNWQGDIHVGQYDDQVMADLRAHHDPRYAQFSVLLRSDFTAACQHFRDGSIDLLHIDGTHTYEAVKRDFELWLPKMSERGVVLLHDTNVTLENFGVKQFFAEVKTKFPSFEFLHGYGLGVLGVGADCPQVVKHLSTLSAEDTSVIRDLFATLGGALSRRAILEQELNAEKEEAKAAKAEANVAKAEGHIIWEQARIAEARQAELNQALATSNQVLGEITNSRGWRLLQKGWQVKRTLNSLLRQPPAAPAITTTPVAQMITSNNNGNDGVSIQISQKDEGNDHYQASAPEVASPLVASVEDALDATTISSRIPSDVLEILTRQVRERLKKLPTETIRPIALYLPQFHRIPENDQWWGDGFTEWTNTRKAVPLFAGHYQPHIPTELGYYDLTDPTVLERQANLAREYGIYGFCYYYYWFNGRRMLEKPLENMLASQRPNFPFCLLWANESWSRSWDGLGDEVLIAQEHSYEDDLRFIQNIIPALRDPRYIRINDRPLLIIYRIGKFTHQSVERWRTECMKAGIGEIYVAATRNYFPVADSLGVRDPRLFGCDAAMEFPPHGAIAPALNHRLAGITPDFQGQVLDYLETAAHYINQPPTAFPFFRGVMTAWDNTARRKNGAQMFYPDNPEIYGYWLSSIAEQTIQRHSNPAERLIFINAWNEWAEGAHLEPDEKHGRSFLEETRKSLGRA